MSSSKQHLRLLAAVALIGAAAALGACGYRPLYATSGAGDASGVAAVQSLESIHVDPIPNREGQMMRTALERRLAVRPGAETRYTLSVTLSESVSTFAVERDAFATRANLELTAVYELKDNQSGKTMTQGQTRAVASYNFLNSEYATFAARQDARKRAIDTLADDIRTRLASYFGGAGPSAAPARP